MIVTALQSFNHGSIRANCGDQINILSTHAKALRDKGLVSFSGLPDDPPSQAGGEPSSASLPAQAAPTTTSNESGDGVSETKPKRGRRKKAEPEATEPEDE